MIMTGGEVTALAWRRGFAFAAAVFSALRLTPGGRGRERQDIKPGWIIFLLRAFPAIAAVRVAGDW
jgi:hypothetical protein